MREFKSIEEVKSLPGYVEKVDKGQHQFDQPLGFYRLEKPVHHCALRSCNHPHGFGYVIQTGSGAVVAVGNVCGPKLFGGAFNRAVEVISRAMARAQAIDDIQGKLSQVPQIVERAQNLEVDAKALNWAVVSLREHCPTRIHRDLDARVESRQPLIEKVRTRTEDDPSPLPGENPRVITDQLGALQGIASLQLPSALSIVSDLLAQAALYADATGERLFEDKSRNIRFSRWFAEVARQFDRVERRLSAAPAFFNTNNLRSLALLGRNPQEKLTAARLIWNPETLRVELAS